LTFTTNYLLSLRLITLVSEDLIYYSLQPITTTTTQYTIITCQSPASISRPYY
ncbi:hypothetical protein GQ607_017644, partial [Colletotrichum asianum]